jgi:FMN phosphatase YigB (HAD superfamily)
VKTFSALSITPLLTAPVTLSQCCGYEKPDERIFRLAVSRSTIGDGEADKAAEGDVREDVIFVGDELEE